MVNLFFLPKKKLKNPDVIIVSSLSPLPIINAYLWSRKYKAKLIFEDIASDVAAPPVLARRAEIFLK